MTLTAKTANEAWELANKLFKTDYEYDSMASKNAGYPVYWSTVKGSAAHINDLCARLEVVDENYNCTNIYIEAEAAEVEEIEAEAAEMIETVLTVGLFDKDTEKQEISTAAAKRIISEMLICKYDIFAFTMIDCNGVYKMQSTGRIVFEPSIRVEIASDEEIQTTEIIADLKTVLNQESIMLKVCREKISFE